MARNNQQFWCVLASVGLPNHPIGVALGLAETGLPGVRMRAGLDGGPPNATWQCQPLREP